MDSSFPVELRPGFDSSSQEDLDWPQFPPGPAVNPQATYPPLLFPHNPEVLSPESTNSSAPCLPLLPPYNPRGSPEAAKPSAPYPQLLLLDNADTLVFIDTPPKASSVSVLPTSPGSIPHRIHCEKLLETGSPFFKQLFDPQTQSRLIKRRGLAGEMVNGIKNAIDLTPPTEGEEAVLTITELSCPLGIRTWARAQSRLSLPLSCVGGEDEVEWSGTSATNEMALPKNEATLSSSSQPSEKVPSNELARHKSCDLPVDYSPLRHRAGIERILQALEDFPPELNTPYKLWTFFGLAKLYGIVTVPKICDLIISWIYQSTNVRFLEAQPELGYRIARGVQCPSLCRETFAILVGEEAMFLLANSNSNAFATPRQPKTTRYGRRRESLDDTELQAIEYASKSFLDHVINKFVYLVSADMAWFYQLPEYQKVFRYQPQSLRAQTCRANLLIHLKHFVRNTLLLSLLPNSGTTWTSSSWTSSRSMKSNDADDEGYPSEKFYSAYRNMLLSERIMSKTYWESLKSEPFEHTWQRGRSSSIIASLAKHIPQLLDLEDWKDSTVSKDALQQSISEFNAFYEKEYGKGGLKANANLSQSKLSDLGFAQYSGASTRDIWTTALFSESSAERFTENVFFEQVRWFVLNYADKMITSPHPNLAYEFTDVLTCLTDKEFKYLPLWAGGNDDGSGGVFVDENIPVMETGGFSAPGPAIHTGSTASTIDSYSNIAPSEANNTSEAASHRATESHHTEVVSLSTESEAGSIRDGGHHSTDWQMTEGDSFDFTSADDDAGDFDSDSDSADTVVVDSPDNSSFVSDFEEVRLSKHTTPPLH